MVIHTSLCKKVPSVVSQLRPPTNILLYSWHRAMDMDITYVFFVLRCSYYADVDPQTVIDADNAISFIDSTDPVSLARLFSLLAEQSHEISSLNTRIESKDSYIQDQSHTISRVSTQLEAARAVAADQSTTIGKLRAEHAALKRSAAVERDALGRRLRELKATTRDTRLQNKRLRADNRALQSGKIALEADKAHANMVSLIMYYWLLNCILIDV